MVVVVVVVVVVAVVASLRVLPVCCPCVAGVVPVWCRRVACVL